MNKVRGTNPTTIKNSKAQQALKLLVKDIAAIERFWSKVSRLPGQGPKGKCWEWKGAKDGSYGRLRYNNTLLRPNRVALAISKGVFGGKLSCHTCDNKLCCRPTHLFSGSNQLNCDDKHAKGRFVASCGYKGIFTDEQVFKIRKLYATGKYTLEAIGKQFSVTGHAIGCIVRHKTYK